MDRISVRFSLECEFNERLDFAILRCKACVGHHYIASVFIVVITCVESIRLGLISFNLFVSIVDHDFLDVAPIFRNGKEIIFISTIKNFDSSS